MYFSKLVFILLLCLFIACTHSTSFDRKVWVDNLDKNDTSNPRAWMVQDVIKNHLKSGMSRKEVLNLLGKPYQEGIERRLPKKTILPDSISFKIDLNLNFENSDKTIDEINKFHKLYAIPIMIIKYPVGWSTIDPNFLIITLDNKGRVEDFWAEQG